MSLTFGSVCSGIEAASVAWEPLGWRPVWFAEIDPAPSRVLAHHYPHVPNLGDFTKIGFEHGAVDVLVGGTPCQSFSVAGLRAGLADARGGLTLEYARLVERLRPRWLVWENVPGVLSADGGRAFASLLRALDELGYGLAWRVLDAQHFGVPQRRRRVFLVGRLGDGAGAREVLFEREGVRRDPAARGEAGKEAARGARARAVALRGGDGGATAELGDDVANALRAANGGGSAPYALVEPVLAAGPIAHALTCHAAKGGDPTTDNYVVEPIPFDTTQITSATNRSQPRAGAPCHPLAAQGHAPAVAFPAPTPLDLQNVALGKDVVGTLDTTRPSRGGGQALLAAGIVRRLTPRECERLQGFPEGYTAILSDSARYKALGNSMAVPCMAWIGRRIAAVEVLS